MICADSQLADSSKPLTAPRAAPRILIIEDEAVFGEAVARRLARAEYTCELVSTLAAAEAWLEHSDAALVLLDIRLPDGSGMDFLQRLRSELDLEVPVILMTAYGEVEDAVAAMKQGATDYLTKPVDLEELLLDVQRVIANQQISLSLKYSRARETHAGDTEEWYGNSPPMQRLREHIERIALLTQRSSEPPPTVLILGETGVGKDVTARRLHALSTRSSRPFVRVDCTSLPQELFESELFGHVKGAFTNAHTDRIGLIEAAEDGVVFLDEIGELSQDMQSKLLSVLERRCLRRVGSSQEFPTSAWFITATNRDVAAMKDEGALRSDLYYRLNLLALTVAPLRQRGEDIPRLINAFGSKIARRYGIENFHISPAAVHALQNYSWPGNVRELKHCIERAVLLSVDGHVDVDTLMLPDTHRDIPSSRAMDIRHMTLDEAEREMILGALETSNGNVSEAARRLGVTRMTLRYRMKKHALD